MPLAADAEGSVPYDSGAPRKEGRKTGPRGPRARLPTSPSTVTMRVRMHRRHRRDRYHQKVKPGTLHKHSLPRR